MSSAVHALFVTWQAPESRRIFPIARVMRQSGGEYEWAYLEAASEARQHGFAGLPGYEDLERRVSSPEPPALFAHRVPVRGRRRPASAGRASPAPANDSFDPAPITLLVPVGPGKVERLEVFAPPLPGPRGRYWGVFVARGVGRAPGSEAAVARLEPHQVLSVVPEPENPVSPRALLLVDAAGARIGYVPDYLANELAIAWGGRAEGGAGQALDPESFGVEVLNAERLTHPPADAVFNVLCQYTCAPALGAQLFQSASYRPR